METVSREKREDIIEIDLKELALLLFRKMWILILVTVAAGAIGFAYCTFTMTPYYTSTTSVYILNKSDNSAMTYSDAQLSIQLTKDYEQLISGRSVLEKVIEEQELPMSYEQLHSKVSVSNVTDTRIIKINVVDADPLKAQILADAIREAAAKHIKEVTNVEAVNAVDLANLPKNPSGPSVKRWTILGASVGFFLCAAAIIMIYLLDDTINTEEDVMKYLGMSTLAVIPEMEPDNKKKKRKG